MTIDRLRDQRAEATEGWRTQFEEPEPGWAVVDVDVAPVLSPFGLACDARLHIFVISEQWGRDGEGHPYAVPAGEAPATMQQVRRQLEEWEDEYPPLVPGSLSDIGGALTSAEDAADLIAVSVAVRELHEMGARGHGATWLDETIIGGSQIRQPSAEEAWLWRGARPHQFDPTVTATSNGSVVVFYTRTEIGGHRVIRYEDRYPLNSLAAIRRVDVVASAPGGAVH